jgi:hypothetical protein
MHTKHKAKNECGVSGAVQRVRAKYVRGLTKEGRKVEAVTAGEGDDEM